MLKGFIGSLSQESAHSYVFIFIISLNKQNNIQRLMVLKAITADYAKITRHAFETVLKSLSHIIMGMSTFICKPTAIEH